MKADIAGLLAAAEPFLRDLDGWHRGLLRIELTPDDPDLSGIAWDSSGAGTGFYVSDGEELSDTAAEMADVLQEAAIEGLWLLGKATNWPPCPEHPDRHPLSAGVQDAGPVWVCPSSDIVVAELGGLQPPGPGG